METKIDRLVREYIAWDNMINSGVGPDGEPVQIDGRLVVEIRPRMLADIGRAAVEAHREGQG